MITSQIVNSLGLLSDIFGVILLFRFGLPSKVREGGKGFLMLEGTDLAGKPQFEKYQHIAQFAVLLLIAGFSLQLVSNFL